MVDMVPLSKSFRRQIKSKNSDRTHERAESRTFPFVGRGRGHGLRLGRTFMGYRQLKPEGELHSASRHADAVRQPTGGV